MYVTIMSESLRNQPKIHLVRGKTGRELMQGHRRYGLRWKAWLSGIQLITRTSVLNMLIGLSKIQAGKMENYKLAYTT